MEMSLLVFPTKYNPGVRTGFILLPHDEGAEGWGEPFFDEEGNPIIPGTLGGPNQRILLGQKEDAWKTLRSRHQQAAGNIDWVGPEYEVGSEKVRNVVTVNGPTSRYWNLGEKFAYDSSESNKEIYQSGRVVGVAPHPVMGACLRKNEGVTWLIAMCKVGEIDVAYAREVVGLVALEKLDLARTAMQALASELNPKGWREIGRAVKVSPTSYPPEVPWFFDCNAKEGRTARRKAHTFDDGGGNSLTQSVWERIKVYITIGSNNSPIAQFSEEHNIGDGIMYRETHTKAHPVWDADGPDPYGLTHTWQEDQKKLDILQQGEIWMADEYDYKTSRWLSLYWKVFNQRYHNQYWSYGIDPSPFNGNDGQNHSNAGSHSSPFTPSLVADPPYPGDHSEAQWLGVIERTYLSIRHNDTELIKFYTGWGNSGSRSMMNGQPWDPSDPYLYFWDSFDVWIHFADIRHGWISGYVKLDQMVLEGYGATYTAENLEWAGRGVDILFEDGADSERFMRNTLPGSSEVGMVLGNDYTEMVMWDETYNVTIDRLSFDGTQSDANATGSLAQPHWKSYYRHDRVVDSESSAWARRGIDSLLGHASRCHRDGLFLTTYKEETLILYQYQDEVSLGTKWASRMWPEGSFTALVPQGNYYIPGGVV